MRLPGLLRRASLRHRRRHSEPAISAEHDGHLIMGRQHGQHHRPGSDEPVAPPDDGIGHEDSTPAAWTAKAACRQFAVQPGRRKAPHTHSPRAPPSATAARLHQTCGPAHAEAPMRHANDRVRLLHAGSNLLNALLQAGTTRATSATSAAACPLLTRATRRRAARRDGSSSCR